MNTPDNENKNDLPWIKQFSTFGVTGALSKNEEAGISGEAAVEPEEIISNVEALSENNTGSIDITLSDATKLPALISERKKRIKQLQKKVKNAEKKAKDAKERAEEASELSAGFGKKKVAIEGLQDAQVEMAKAIEEQSKAQAALQEYQTFITQVTESLFALGVTSLAMNRTVVRELKESLSEDKNAKNKLDKYAREEILNVIKQLKAQEDIMIKQEQTVDKVKSNKERLDLLTEDNRIVKERSLKNEEELERQAEKDVEHDTLIAEQAEKDIEHDKALAEQAEKDIEHDKMLAEQAEKDAEHDRILEEQAEKDAEHDKILEEQAEKDAEHDKILEEQAEKDAEHDKILEEQAEKDAEHDRILEEQAEKDAEHDRILEEQAEKDAEHDRILEKQTDKDREHDRLIAKHENELNSVREELRRIEEIHKKRSKKNSILIAVLFVIVVLLIILIALVGTGVVKFSTANIERGMLMVTNSVQVQIIKIYNL